MKGKLITRIGVDLMPLSEMRLKEQVGTGGSVSSENKRGQK